MRFTARQVQTPEGSLAFAGGFDCLPINFGAEQQPRAPPRWRSAALRSRDELGQGWGRRLRGAPLVPQFPHQQKRGALFPKSRSLPGAWGRLHGWKHSEARRGDLRAPSTTYRSRMGPRVRAPKEPPGHGSGGAAWEVLPSPKVPKEGGFVLVPPAAGTGLDKM